MTFGLFIVDSNFVYQTMLQLIGNHCKQLCQISKTWMDIAAEAKPQPNGGFLLSVR